MSFSYQPITLGGLLYLLLFSCSPNQSAQHWMQKTEQQWAKLDKQSPEWPEMLDSSALASRLQFLQWTQQAAKEWMRKPLDSTIKGKLDAMSRRFEEVESHLAKQRKDPSLYNLGVRLQGISDVQLWEKYLDEAPEYYRQARQKLSVPEPALCDSAIQQHIRSIARLQTLANVKGKARLNHKIGRACFYMKDYLAWCRSSAFEARNGAL